jgi:hypothetical protein
MRIRLLAALVGIMAASAAQADLVTPSSDDVARFAVPAAAQMLSRSAGVSDEDWMAGLRSKTTPWGANGMLKAWRDNANLLVLKRYGGSFTAAASGEPVARNEGGNAWRVVVPMHVVYETTTHTIRQDLTVSAKVLQDENTGALRIDQLLAY